MNDNRSICATFCDDVRRELGNKLSLIGCYSGEMIVEKFPSTLAKVCVYVVAQTPIDEPFERLVFRAFLNDEILAEVEVDSGQLLAWQGALHQRNAKKFQHIAVMGFSPLLIPSSGRLLIEADTEQGTIYGGQLFIRAANPEEKLFDGNNLS